MNFTLKVGNKTVVINVAVKTTEEPVMGWTNRCEDGKYIVVLDYDRLKVEWIEEEISQLQGEFGLGDFFIVQSSDKGYHAICPDKLNYCEWIKVLKNSSADLAYVDVPLKYGMRVWTLRATSKRGFKPRFVKMIKGNPYRTKSNAHLLLMDKLYSIKTNYKRRDCYTNIIRASYET